MNLSFRQATHGRRILLRRHRAFQFALELDSLLQLLQIGFEFFYGLIALIDVFAEAFKTIHSNSGGAFGAKRASAGGSDLAIATMISVLVSPENEARPVAIS